MTFKPGRKPKKASLREKLILGDGVRHVIGGVEEHPTGDPSRGEMSDEEQLVLHGMSDGFGTRRKGARRSTKNRFGEDER